MMIQIFFFCLFAYFYKTTNPLLVFIFMKLRLLSQRIKRYMLPYLIIQVDLKNCSYDKLYKNLTEYFRVQFVVPRFLILHVF